MQVGVVGGISAVHPTSRICIKIAKVKSARQLGCVIVSAGLAQNFSALHALATDGIQRGHMGLHARSGGCLIATAAYGTELAPQIQTLREIRDNTLMETSSGTSFMAGFNTFYYTFSPAIADWERQSPAFASAVGAFLTPLISTLSIMNLAENTDSSVLALGISVIALNVGIYIGTPIGATYGVRKILKRSRA